MRHYFWWDRSVKWRNLGGEIRYGQPHGQQVRSYIVPLFRYSADVGSVFPSFRNGLVTGPTDDSKYIVMSPNETFMSLLNPVRLKDTGHIE